MKAGQAPVIVVRRIKKAHAHHGGAWKVAYADFVTAMMAFFLVMWLASQDAVVREAIAGYFQQSGVMPNEKSNSVVAMGAGGIAPGGPAMQPKKPDRDELLKAEKKRLEEAAQHIQDRLLTIPDVSSLRDQVELIITPEGLRIELLEKSGSSFFATGSSKLRGESVEILTIIAEELGKLPNDIKLEGHTDRQQYRRDASYNNWDLSSDRANSARRVMQVRGLRDGQLHEVNGFADTYLRISADPLDPRNRRVSILVKSQVVEPAPKDIETPAGK